MAFTEWSCSSCPQQAWKPCSARNTTERQIRRGTRRNTVELEQAILQLSACLTRHAKAFVWTKTADQILDSVKRFGM